MRKIFIFSIAFYLTISASLASAESINPELFDVPNIGGVGRVGYVNLPGEKNLNRSYLAARVIKDNKLISIAPCSNLSDSACVKADAIDYAAQLGICESSESTNCIVSVEAVDSDGKRLPGEAVGTFPHPFSSDFKGDPTVNLPSGGSMPLIKISGAEHAGGNLYLPTIRLIGGKAIGQAAFGLGEMQVSLHAISIVAGSYKAPELPFPTDMSLYGGDPMTRRGVDLDSSRCIAAQEDKCAVPSPLPLDKKFSITIKTSFEIPGWMKGAIANPLVTITKAGKSIETTFLANPVIVPVISVMKNYNEFPTGFLDFYQNNQSDGAGTDCPLGVYPIDFSKCGYVKIVSRYDNAAFTDFLRWLPLAGDTAFIDPTTWRFVLGNEGGNFGNCQVKDSELAGIVSTNASMFISGPPTWDKANQTLDYKVAAPHYLSDKSIFKGSYDLMIKSSLARCIYGFSNAPLSATVSIISADGTPQVATTLVREAGGYIYLSAKGFTFSNPTVQVKFAQTSDLKKVPDDISVNKIATKKTLVCAKAGKKITITAIKCPSGYKTAK